MRRSMRNKVLLTDWSHLFIAQAVLAHTLSGAERGREIYSSKYTRDLQRLATSSIIAAVAGVHSHNNARPSN